MKQKLVFYGLIRWPDLNDAALAERIDVDRRTIAAIRKTLKSKGMFDVLYMPDFRALGLELLTITYGSFKQFPKTMIKADSLSNKVTGFPELVYSWVSHSDFLNMYLSQRFTDFKLVNERLMELYNKYGSIENVVSVNFPLELSRLIFLFDFAPALKRMFGIDLAEEAEKGELDRGKERTMVKRLSEKEKKVLYTLSVFPDATDGRVAELTKISRPTVNTIRERLHHDGILKELKMPDLFHLGYELVVLSHCKLDMDFMKEVYFSERVMQKHVLPTQPFFLITDTTEPESVLFLIFENFTKYKECQDQIGKFAKDHRLSPGQVNELIFPLEKLEILKNLNFGPLVKKVLGVDLEI